MEFSISVNIFRVDIYIFFSEMNFWFGSLQSADDILVQINRDRNIWNIGMNYFFWKQMKFTIILEITVIYPFFSSHFV